MEVRVTILCENSVGIPFGLLGEHGFACFVETGEGNYLFDTGQGATIIPNAQLLKKDLSIVQAIMLSHGHYDHTGGLAKVLTQRGEVDVYGHEGLFAERVWSEGDVVRDIGIPYRRTYLESLGARFKLGRQLVEVGPGVYLSGEIPRLTDFERNDPTMTLISSAKERIHPDPVADDLSMILRGDKGLIVVLGCAHAGMVNILESVRTNFAGEKIFAVIGGTHLGFSSEVQFQKTLEAIDDYDIGHIGVSHCTGFEKAARLYSHLGDRFFFGSVGAVVKG